MMKLRIGIVLLLVAGLVSCSKKKDPEPLAPPELEVFPPCKLIAENFAASYGTVQRTTYHYQNNRLARTYYFHNNQYNSAKRFVYSADGNVSYMLTFDTLSSVLDTIAAYQFANGLLSKFTHYHTSTGAILAEAEYEYQNGHLRMIRAFSDGETVMLSLLTDAKGNPVRMKIDLINGQPPQQPMHVEMQYDNKLNPFYHLPDFIDTRYFTQNNLVQTNQYVDNQLVDTEQFVLQYEANGLLRQLIDNFSQGTHTTTYSYQCD